MPGRTELHKIFKLCGTPSEEYWKKSNFPHAIIFKPLHAYRRCISEAFREIPLSALALLDVLLSIDPSDRGTAASALNRDFFTTELLPCDLSSLPKYPPREELYRMFQDDEERRRWTVGKIPQLNLKSSVLTESRATHAPISTAKFAFSRRPCQRLCRFVFGSGCVEERVEAEQQGGEDVRKWLVDGSNNGMRNNRDIAGEFKSSR